MKRFKNILVVVDGKEKHEATIKRAVELAKTNQAVLTFVEIMEEIPQELKTFVRSKSAKDFHDIIFRENLVHLEYLLEPIKKEGVQASAKVLIGKPFIEIIREVLRNGRDLVMMTEERDVGLWGRVFGSTALHLMRKCPCPVWIIKQEQRRKFARVLVPIDPVIHPDEEYDASKDELSIKLLEIGSSLARAEGSELHVFHAWTVLYEGLMQSRAGISPEEIEALRSKTKLRHQQIIAELVAKHAPDVPNNYIHVWRGEAGKLIPKIVQDKEFELIVMGTVSRTGISGLLIGNTAERILNNVDCSVLAVKPDGFISPVKIDGPLSVEED